MKHLFKGGRAIIIEGPQGSGKTTLANLIADACGTKTTVMASHMFRQGHIVPCDFDADTVIVEEYVPAPADLGILKCLTGSPSITSYRKGANPVVVPTPNFILCTGSLDAIPAGFDERRFMVISLGGAS
jgi:energy-coupling factor transporter ATP-binding protein EcfA2